MEEIKKRLTMFIIFAVFIGLVIIIYFSYKNWSKQQEKGKYVTTEIINPYFESIKKQKYEVVYNSFFSSNFKNKYNIDEFIKAHKDHQVRFGNLLKWENRAIEGINEIGGAKYLRLKYGLYFDKEKNIVVVYDIIKENDKYYINESYYLKVNTLTPQIW